MKYQKEINKAKEIIQKYNPLDIIPFPFENVVNGEVLLKGIHYIDFTALNKTLDKNIAGLILYDKESEEEYFSVLVSKSDSINRQYFTVAHELGHYFLHKDILRDKGIVSDTRESIAMFRGDLPGQAETEANYFAAELIMPENKIREMFVLLNGDIDDMAKFFKVSKVSMAIRLDVLNLDE